jgi:hypothetical protein
MNTGKNTPITVAVGTTAIALLVACGSSDVTTQRVDVGVADVNNDSSAAPDGRDDAGDDNTPGDVANDETPTDSSDDRLDTDIADVSVEPGSPCTTDSDCEPLLCYAPVPGDVRGICVVPCATQAQCAEDELCQRVSGVGGDLQLVCVPDGLCVDRDADEYGFGGGCRGPDCNDDDPAIYLGATERCDGVDNDCDGEIDDDLVGIGVACVTGFAGECASGRIACVDGGEQCVSDEVPTDERCDGLDNNCDGAIDEAADGTGALWRACYSGPAATRDVGTCRAGSEFCIDGAWGSCTDQVLPGAEVCSGIDEDCDGTPDNGNPGAGLLCVTGQPGECSTGVTACEGGVATCIATSAGRPEVCDGVDNNCDGTIDDGDPGGGELCSSGLQGVCAAGFTVCSSGSLSCVSSVPASPEVCDGLDNNCNGAPDEGNPGGGVACNTGRPGICSAGTTRCERAAIECLQDTAAIGELCDSLDNNCNGVVNDGCPTAISFVASANGPQYGGGGGTAFSSPCIAGSALVGLAVRSGSEVDAVAARCAPITLTESTATNPYSYNATTGPVSTLTQYGGGGGSAYSNACAANQVVIGLNLRAAGRVDQVQWICGTLAVTGAPGSLSVSRTPVATSPAYGGSGGDPYSYTCPDNQVVTGIFGRYGSRLDALGVICARPQLALR